MAYSGQYPGPCLRNCSLQYLTPFEDNHYLLGKAHKLWGLADARGRELDGVKRVSCPVLEIIDFSP